MVPERFPLVHIGQVHFDERDRRREECVAERERGVGVGTEVDDRAIGMGAQPLHHVHQLPFVVRLDPLDGHVEGRGAGADLCLELRERRGAVDRRLALAEEIEKRVRVDYPRRLVLPVEALEDLRVLARGEEAND